MARLFEREVDFSRPNSNCTRANCKVQAVLVKIHALASGFLKSLLEVTPNFV